MKSKTPTIFRRATTAAFVATALASLTHQPLRAASGTWLGTADGNWGVNGNWSGASFPNGATQAANFQGNATLANATVTTTLDGNYTVGTMNKAALAGGTPTNWTVTSPTNTLTFNNNLSNSTISNSFNGISVFTLDTSLVLSSNLIISGNGNNNARVVIGAVPGERTITGAGNITFNNTFASGAGQLVINSNINTTGGIFNNSVQGVNTSLIAGNIGSTVTGVTQNGNRTLTLSGNNTYTGATTVNLGSLNAGVTSVAGVSGAFGNNSAVTIATTAATLNLNGFNTQIGSLAGGNATGGTVAIGSATLTVGGDNTNTTYSGNITGNGGLIKIGSGNLTLDGNNPFTGNITVNQGTLVAGRAGAADINNAFAVNLNGGSLQLRTDGSFGKSYSTVRLNVNSASTLSYNNTGNTTQQLLFSGANAFALGANLTIQNISSNTTLDNVINISRNITGTGAMIVETYNNINSGTTNFGRGRVALGGNNTAWSGNLIIRQGTAEVFGNSTLGAVSAGTGTIILGETANSSGAGFLLSASSPTGAKTIANEIIVRTGGFRTIRGQTDHSYQLTGNVTLEGDLNIHNGLSFTDKSMIFSGNISGSGGLSITESGNPDFVRLSGTNTYTGATSVGTNATLNILGGSSVGDTSAVTLAAGATLVFNANNETIGSLASAGSNGTVNMGANTLTTGGDNTTTTYGGAINGVGGSLTKVGTGTMTLTNTTTYNGTTTVSAGGLIVDLNNASAAVNVSSGARIGGDGTLAGNLSLDSGARFALTGGALKVSGTVTFANSFDLASLVNASGGSVDWSGVNQGIYALVSLTGSSLSNIGNFGFDNRAAIGDKVGYFQGDTGLQLVVIPEASTWAIVGIGLFGMVVFHRCRRRSRRA